MTAPGSSTDTPGDTPTDMPGDTPGDTALGVVFRAMSGADLPQVVDVRNRASAHDGLLTVMSVEELTDELGSSHLSMADDTLVAVVDETVVGYAYAYHLPSRVRVERCYVFGDVDPGWRGRGIGRALLGWGTTRATDLVAGAPPGLERWVMVDRPEGAERTDRLFRRMGYRPVRWFDQLIRPLTDLPDLWPVEGIRIEPWPTHRDAEILAEKNESFADHWGSTPNSPEAWASMVHGFGARPDLSFVALVDAPGTPTDGAVVAHCLAKRFEADDAVNGRRDGWIDNLGTLAAWRGRGVASALVTAVLHGFARAGFSHACLVVDGDSPTGAGRLYRSLGFETDHRMITHQLGA